MIKTGDILDNTYKILEEIGTGGSGIIYKAYHIRLKKYLVIKLLKNEVRNKLNERSEVDILKNLKHTYLPQVYDFLIEDDNVYTVMDFIPGKSLYDELKKRNKFSTKKVIKWGIQLCEALSYLHTRNVPIIHSDIKPENIMLMPDDNICLIDFNISLLFNNELKTICYSDGYSPPEQKSIYNIVDRMYINTYDEENIQSSMLSELNCGKTYRANKTVKFKIDTRADIYSLGATLYHLITGEKPNSDILLMNKKIKLDHRLGKIIFKAMNEDVNKRYQSAEEMLSELICLNRYDNVLKEGKWIIKAYYRSILTLKSLKDRIK